MLYEVITVGDFLYSRSFQMMVKLQKMRVMEILAEATNTICEGEVLQLRITSYNVCYTKLLRFLSKQRELLRGVVSFLKYAKI